MGWGSNSIFQVVIIQGGGITGLFEYNGLGSLGNPPVAYAAAPGVTHDPFGNVLPATIGGFVSVSGATFSELSAGLLQFGTTGAVVTTNPGLSGSGTSGQLSLASGTLPASPQNSGINLLPAAAGVNPVIQAVGLLREIAVAAGVEAFAVGVVSDVHDRLAIDSNGGMSWGTGALAADTTLARTGAGQLTIGSTLIVGTVLTNLLELTSAALPAAVSGSAILAADASGFLNMLPDSASGDTTDYHVGHFTSFATTDQLINSTTFASVCGTAPVVGAGKYRVHAELTCVQGPNANPNDYRLGFTGTISQVRMKMVSGQDATNMFLATTTSNNGLLATHGWAAGSTYTATFHGIIVTTSTGTLSIQAAMDAAGDTFTILALSDFHLERVG